MNQIQRNHQNTVQNFDDTSNVSVYEQDVGLPPRSSWRNSIRNSLTNNYLSKGLTRSSAASNVIPPRRNNDPPLEVNNYISNAHSIPNNRNIHTYIGSRGFGNDTHSGDYGISMKSRNELTSVSNLELNNLETISENFDNTLKRKRSDTKISVSCHCEI